MAHFFWASTENKEETHYYEYQDKNCGSKEGLETVYISVSDAFRGPGAVVVEPLHTVVAVGAVLGVLHVLRLNYFTLFAKVRLSMKVKLEHKGSHLLYGFDSV